MARLKQIVVAADQLLNAILGGYADETFSARCWRKRYQKPYFYLYRWIDVLFFWEDDHCEDSYLSEVERRYLPYEYVTRN